MTNEHRDFELWRERNWRCEWWTVSGRPEVRLYLGSFKVGELMAGPNLDLWQQAAQWRLAAHADTTDTQLH